MATLIEETGLSYKDVTILPGSAPLKDAPDSTKPEYYDLRTRLAGDVITNTPWIASNMTTVVDEKNAYRYVQNGIFPVIPQFPPIKKRVALIRELRNTAIDTQKFPNANVDSEKRPLIGAAVGYENATKSAIALAEAGASIIIFDSANGYTPGFIKKTSEISDAIKKFRDSHIGSYVAVAAGNVGTADGARDLYEAGADAVKAILSWGAACATGPETAVSTPPVTTGLLIAPVAEHFGKTFWLDGGVRDRYDAVIAASLSHGVMSGYIYVSTDAAPFQFEKDGQRHAIYRGSASEDDRKKREEAYPELYPQRDYKAPEGLNGSVLVKGTLEQMVFEYNRALRTTMWYVRARTLNDFRKYAELLPLSQASEIELKKTTLYTLVNEKK